MAALLQLCVILAGISQLHGKKLPSLVEGQNVSMSFLGLSESVPSDMHPSKGTVQELNSNSVMAKTSLSRMKMQAMTLMTAAIDCAYTPITVPFFVTPLLLLGLVVLASLQLVNGNGLRGFLIVIVYLMALSLISISMKQALEELPYPVSISLLHKVCTAMSVFAVEMPKLDIALTIMPVAVLAGAAIVFGNVALNHGSVAVVTAIGTCNPVFTLFLQAARGKEFCTTANCLTVSFVTLGTALCISGELHLSMICVAVATVGTLCRAVRNIHMQQMMQQAGAVSPPQVNFWTCIWAIPLCMVFLSFEEGVSFIAAFQQSTNWGRLSVLLSVMCAVVLNSVGVEALKLIGAVAQGMISNLSLIVTMLLGSVLIHEEITLLQLIGGVVAPLGMFLKMHLQETRTVQADK
eukprot:TRINITY_DN3464_c0_g1_i2.p1 TRINITY_DN3464_c0_g1~~TRINITY_DN3464_c0_g1_i2.p1  ORF type:complete len:407 (+),score=77.32 TRINITY_DN3464_c0_g1_i2:86-1306(+)